MSTPYPIEEVYKFSLSLTNQWPTSEDLLYSVLSKFYVFGFAAPSFGERMNLQFKMKDWDTSTVTWALYVIGYVTNIIYI